MVQLKPFGVGDSSYEIGYTLPTLLGHLEALCFTEDMNRENSVKGPSRKRIELVETAIQCLYDAVAMGKEEG